MNNQKLDKYLKEFKKSNWMDDSEWLVKQKNFFKKFFKRENLEKMQWKDMQEMGDYIHSFNSLALAKKRALGKPNHPIKHYRNSLIYLIYGKDDDTKRFDEFVNGKYKLRFFGESSCSEIIGQAFSDKYVLFNGRDIKAPELFDIKLKYNKKDKFGKRYIQFNEAIEPVIEEYKKVVGLQNKKLTIAIEVDQFFSYLYENVVYDVNIINIMKDKVSDYIEYRLEKTEHKGKDEYGAGKWTESYKWDLLPKIQKEFFEEKLNEDTIVKKIEILQKHNPQSGSFVHWSNLDDLKKIAKINPALVVKLFEYLFDEKIAIDKRIDNFIEEIKTYNSKVKLGTPLFGYILAIFNYKKYPLYKDSTFKYVKKMIGKDEEWKSFTIGEKYKIFSELCNEMGQYFIDKKLLKDITRENILIKAGFTALDGQDFFYIAERVIGGETPVDNTEVNYWWLNTNPKIWDLANAKIDEKIIYTSYNERGNQRRIFRHFNEVKPGDKIIGYVSTPILEAVAICEITKSLHNSKEGEGFEFKKIEDFKNGVSFRELRNIPELRESEPLINNTGSLFKLEQNEYEIIRDLLDEKNPKEKDELEKYSKKNALDVLFLKNQEYDQILDLLAYKKNIILQGPPGVGKTFIAKKIAYTIMGVKDESRVQMIQFHQSYSYEDFIQGYRPTDDGKFTLKNGIFYDFCRKAQKDKDNKYFFIIDEINRGNLSKILGELMMLIEKDKRGEEFSIPLTYSETQDEKFYIPENLYLIGTMNTADKSLAMVDYALRRRFCFSFLEPKFNDKFRNYLKDFKVKVELIDKIINRITKLNQRIKEDTKNLGKGYMIGHSYFCPDDKQEDFEIWYMSVVNNELKPLLEEYWFDDDGQAQQEINKLIN